MLKESIRCKSQTNYYDEERREYEVTYFSPEHRALRSSVFRNETDARDYLSEKLAAGRTRIKFTTRIIYVEEQVEAY